MNYINNSAGLCCCTLGDNDMIRVERQVVLVDTVSGKVSTMDGLSLGHTYRCEERWALVKSYAAIAYYQTETAARSAYNGLIADLAEISDVFAVSEG